jgi:hypothetical protein
MVQINISDAKYTRSVGITTSLIGLLLMIAPRFVGSLVVGLLGVALIALGVMGLFISLSLFQTISRGFAVIPIITGVILLVYPGIASIVIGLSLIASGIYQVSKRQKTGPFYQDRHLILAVIMILSGLYALLRPTQSLGLLVLILGIVLFIGGIYMILQKPTRETHSHINTSEARRKARSAKDITND